MPRGTSAAKPPSAFTLVEVLAALAFMAIVIPVAIRGIQVASRAGQVALRKAEATRVAERILNESMISTNWNKSTQSGTFIEGSREFRWQLGNRVWTQEPMRLVTVQVTYSLQGKDYEVHLSTLADGTVQ